MPQQERRHFTRIPFDAQAILSEPDSGQSWACVLLDISLKGALTSRPTDWQGQQQCFKLSLQLSGEADSLRLSMEVSVAHQGENHIGFHCNHMDLDTATHLHRLLELNLGDEKLLERELSELAGFGD